MASAGRQTKPTESAGKCNPLQARVKKGISTQVKDITTTEIKYQPTNISYGTFIVLKYNREYLCVGGARCRAQRAKRMIVEILSASRLQLSHPPSLFFNFFFLFSVRVIFFSGNFFS